MKASSQRMENLPDGQIMVNGQVRYEQDYITYHRKRIAFTIEKLRKIGARRIVEIGADPWVMTASLIADPSMDVCATVSAQEVTNWPDDIGVNVQRYHIRNGCGKEAYITNYSANIERILFELHCSPDTAVACEIVEHLIRSPHVMFLNINRWLPLSGRLLVTTPNAAQFSNPFRRRSPTPAYRCNVYERHSYLYTLDQLAELIKLCGFKVSESGYWDVYEPRGVSAIYDALSYVPFKYFRDKFKKTIFVVAEKIENVAELKRCPSVYDPRGEWEFIKRNGQ